jgi:uncharacterized membrane-anchored protein
MNITEEIVNQVADQMAKDIDTLVLMSALGWTSVKLDRFRNGTEAVDIIDWIDANCTGEWKNLSTRYIFEKKQDAEWFILRWQ